MKSTRDGWRPGPWDDEPDRHSWVSGVGLPCEMFREGKGGAWCGYVGVPLGHDYCAMDPKYSAFAHRGIGVEYDNSEWVWFLHGDDSLAGKFRNMTWVGFACARPGDVRPVQPKEEVAAGSVYRTDDYVAAECECLAVQIDAATVLSDAGFGGHRHARGVKWSAPTWAVNIALDFSRSRAERLDFLARLARDPVAAKLAEASCPDQISRF